MRVRQRQFDARAGFTLAELLMVIAIIVVLVALSAAAVIKFFNVGPHQATQTNLQQLKSALDKQWSEVAGKAQRELMNMTVAQIDPNNTISPAPKSTADERVRKKYVEYRLAQAFPISFVEIFNPPNPPMGAWPAYNTYLTDPVAKGGLGLTAATAAAVPLDQQQGICLQMILERGPFNPALTSDKLGKSQSVRLPSPAADAVVDAWGQPLLFTRNYKGASGVVGLVSMGADKKAGVFTDAADCSKHTLAYSSTDADDNVAVPD